MNSTIVWHIVIVSGICLLSCFHCHPDIVYWSSVCFKASL